MFFKGIIIVAGIILVAISIVVLTSYDFQDSPIQFDELSSDNSKKMIAIAKQFIVSSPTFSYDGISDTLEIEIISSNVDDSKFFLKGKFKTLHAGFGNRENLDLSEDITLHTIDVMIVDGKIISAVIDNQWDELNQITCNTATC
ncbi:hypothetical protein [Nitrosopumilus sp.]|uniref:hypothetical protein n=1 Tax=Nitrosopumilus sp. TaxID=2024843 RepID=UPI00247C47CA|nr:hypothetical protein [Nitrosopumilus sp.]MCV0410429.1 hypothetical protein [Nitrosopumilus sp.]